MGTITRSLRARIALVATSIAVLVAIAAVVFFVGDGGDGDVTGGVSPSPTATSPTEGSPTQTSPPTTTPTTPSPTTTKTTPAKPVPAAGTWQRLPAAPVPAGYRGQAVWTGKEFLLFEPVFPQGGTPRTVGVAYNPKTGTWRTLPPTPDPPVLREGMQATVWAGKEMLTWGTVDAAYNPKANTWRRLPPGWESPAVTVWTGRQVLLWGGGCCGGQLRNGVSYDPVTGARRPIPHAPFGGQAQGVWTGREMVVVGSVGARQPQPVAAAYNPVTRTWRSLPRPSRLVNSASMTWTGREVLVVGGGDYTRVGNYMYADGIAYNPATNRWRRLPAMEFARSFHAAVWTGSRLLVWGGVTPGATGGYATASHGVVYDPARNSWSALPKSPLRGRMEPLAVWTGTTMIVWGGDRVSEPYGVLTDGAIYRP